MLGIIGGTGLYKIEGLETLEEKEVKTPFGATSGAISVGKIGETKIAFLPRHGKNHQILPGEINYRANLWAMKSVGVTQILSVSATGSLQEEIKPGDLAVPNQYVDWTSGKRTGTFFGEGLVAHISTAEPSCPNLAANIRKSAEQNKTHIHFKKTYVCVEGPRLGTRSESMILRQNGCDLVGMTNVPEVFLAREAQLCYATIAIATDYDSWQEDPSQHATVAKVIELYGKNMSRVQAIVKTMVSTLSPLTECGCRKSLEWAIMTKEEILSPEKKELLAFLRK